jgi:benzaldehyde dehydrogenase (NAD)
VVLKPDHQTPLTGGVFIARVLEEAGLPAGLLQMLPGGPEAGAALCEDPNVAMISFTGSTSVGRIIAESAGRHLKKLSLELGGSNSLIILDDADVDVAASNVAWGIYLHQGQICMASNRIFVQQGVLPALIEKLIEKANKLPVGNPAEPGIALGPLINEKQALRVESLVKQAIEAGATLETGGERSGCFFMPTVLSGVTPDMEVFKQEVFGPVANIMGFGRDSEAVTLANQHRGSLAAGVISGDVGRAMQLGNRLNTGMVHINDQTVNDDCVNPFGGPGVAGNGVSVGGSADWSEYTQWRWTTVKSMATPYPF